MSTGTDKPQRTPAPLCGRCGGELPPRTVTGAHFSPYDCVTHLSSLYEQADNARLGLREALDNLAHAAREFSTVADYTAETGIEDEFVSALENAEQLLESQARS